MRQQLQQCEQRLQQRDATSQWETDAMQQQLRDQRNRIQEQHAQLAMAQQHMRDNIQGKKDYETHVYQQTQTVMNRYEQIEKHAEEMKHEREHQQYLSAMAEAQRQQ